MSAKDISERPVSAVIPARGGSKRVPQKNIRPLCGKPLIGYTINAALESGIFDHVIVSTDCPDIAAAAEKYGAKVPFMRDPELADDMTHAPLVTLDALDRLYPEGTPHGMDVAQLLPNCPLRNARDIRESHCQFLRTGADSLISVTRFGCFNPWWAMTMDEDYFLHPLFREKMKERSQDLPELFTVSGAICLARVEVLRQHKTFHIGKYAGYELPWQRAVDIDTEEDWQLAEFLMHQTGC